MGLAELHRPAKRLARLPEPAGTAMSRWSLFNAVDRLPHGRGKLERVVDVVVSGARDYRTGCRGQFRSRLAMTGSETVDVWPRGLRLFRRRLCLAFPAVFTLPWTTVTSQVLNITASRSKTRPIRSHGLSYLGQGLRSLLQPRPTRTIAPCVPLFRASASLGQLLPWETRELYSRSRRHLSSVSRTSTTRSPAS